MDPVIGREKSGLRPVIVVSSNGFHEAGAGSDCPT